MSGIYVHIPFCKSKCIYCDFYSIAVQSLIGDYCNALKKEIAFRSNQLTDRHIRTIYFGGGTPSMLEIGKIEGILSEIYNNYTVDSNAEITLEANPENLNAEYLHQLRQIGINRLSIGIQSFDDATLKFLKRRHTAKDAIESVLAAQKCGFGNISIDLIYGITGIDNKMWEKQLDTAFSLPISHLSCYCLGIEDNTLLHRYTAEGKYIPSDDESCLQQFLAFDSKVSENGFEHYEISNASKPNMRSQHNSSYWNRTEYLGFGPEAHSYYNGIRAWNIANVKEYIKGISEGNMCLTTETLSETDIFEETIMLGLRTSEGINLREIEQHFGNEKVTEIRAAISKLQPDLYKCNGDNISLTPKGMFVSDSIIVEFIG
ncbi:MAG: radical SAM family heme chaperone HemW [Bacteroidales bacterium]|nr:radical SAM family heme chaperone HemW [Bacteroidales bacterium]